MNFSNPLGPALAPAQAPPRVSLTGRFNSIVGSTPIPLMILVAVIIIVAVIIFIVVKVKKGSFTSTDLLKKPIVLANPASGDFQIAPAAKLPDTNGNELSYSLWMYVDNVSVTNDHKIVMYRGNSADYRNGSFFVYMDAKTNSLYASLRTTGALDEVAGNSEPTLQDIKSNKYFLHSSIDYVPLQRWVNVTYTIKDTVLSTYLDGDLYSVTSVYELPQKPDGSRPLTAKQAGDVMLGGKNSKEGFNGYLGTCKFFNYTLTISQAKQVYNHGPYTKSWLSYIGLGNVGLRTPVYVLTAEDMKK